jgi:hypothetical protein
MERGLCREKKTLRIRKFYTPRNFRERLAGIEYGTVRERKISMRTCCRLVVGILLVLLAGLSAHAEIKVVVERNRGDDATPKFKFKNIASPVGDDAASKAKFTLVDGRKDDESGELDVLHDGKLPTEEDQPSSNFFLAQNEDNGRLAIDLGKAIDIKQVNTYSWHPNTRAAQVYKLYAADGSASGFNAEPKNDTDPAKCGWKLVTTVDTRPKEGEVGGQYGVSISDSAGAIGKYRYLLFDISVTEKDDPFGNTFYSEIDVIAASEPKTSEGKPAPTGRLISRSPASAPYQITIDYTDAPELKDWVEKKLQPTSDTWYPKIIEALPSKNYTPPKTVSISITNNYRGVAATGGNRVSCSAAWFKQNYGGEGPGAVVHELVHVVQQYRGRGGARNPGWLVEGVADYIRWFKYEPKPTGTRPRNPDSASYTDSYRTTAGFLNYVVDKHDKEIVVKLNAAMREGKYSPDLWKQYTGKSVDELWKLYVATLN